jgi:ABC-type transport system substrate-binding protein
MTIIVNGFLGPLLLTGGLASAAPAQPLLPAATYTAAILTTPSPASPWTIDPQRTQEITA